MIVNYLKLSFRLLARNPFFTTINVVGLAIGFVSFCTLWEFATSELRSDQFHKNYERIVRIGTHWRWTDDDGKTWGHMLVGTQLTYLQDPIMLDQSEIDASVRIMNPPAFSTASTGHQNQILISVLDQSQPRIFKEKRAAYADANLFEFFSFPLIYGQPDNVLSEDKFVVLSKSTAIKYFGQRNPTGELLKLNDTITLKVSGVYDDLPPNSHFNFDLVISNRGLLNRWNDSKNWSWSHLYVRLKEPQSFGQLESGLNKRKKEYFAEVQRSAPNTEPSFFVQPLEQVAFSQSFDMDPFSPKSKTFLFTLAFIALSVLLMALVNYVNLTVTRITKRFKEVATRKVSGAGSLDMMMQFTMEAVVVNLLALVLALTLIQLVRTPMSYLFNIHISGLRSLSGLTAFIFLGIALGGMLLSGLYPALIFRMYQARTLFRMGSLSSGKRIIPSVLTISQFAAALVFILFGFVVSLQLNYILNKDAGIRKDEILIIEGPIVTATNSDQDIDVLKKQMAQLPGLSDVTSSSVVLGDLWDEMLLTKRVGADLFFGMDNAAIDEKFIPFYEVKLTHGRNFISEDRASTVIISHFATSRLGFKKPEDAVGQTIRLTREADATNWLDAEVIGVFEDFRVFSLLNMTKTNSEYSQEGQGRGIVFLYKDKLFPSYELKRISLKLTATEIETPLREIESLYSKQFPGNSFTWYFLDEHANRAYGNEKIARNQIILFTGLAIIIACMGLLGMISYKATEKTKEIGIRKTLGAKSAHIGSLLLNSTIKHITIAVIIGLPLSWYLIQQYFEKFAEHIMLQWWHYALPVVILILIMLSTVASVLYKAARNNPVDALKYE